MKTVVIALALVVAAQQHTSLKVFATSFTHMTGPNAKYNGSGFACWKKPGTNRWATWGAKGYRYVKMNGREIGIAHRTLRCGTLVELTYRSLPRHGGDGRLRRVLVPVIDRGPYWAVPKTCTPRWGYNCYRRGVPATRLPKGRRYITDVDMTVLVKRQLRFPGMGVVTFRVVPRVLRQLTR